jgi:hypothetical protein
MQRRTERVCPPLHNKTITEIKKMYELNSFLEKPEAAKDD